MIKTHIYGYNEVKAGKTNQHTWLHSVPRKGDIFMQEDGQSFDVLNVAHVAGGNHINLYLKKDMPEVAPAPLSIVRDRKPWYKRMFSMGR